MTDVGEHHLTKRAAAARATVLTRLLDSATKTPDPPQGPIAFPAFIPSIRCVKYSNDGGLWVMLQIPHDYVEEYYTVVCRQAGKPLVVSLEEVDIAKVDTDA